MTVLNAYLHKVQATGNLHVKVQQPMALSDKFAADMHRCGSPATWTFSKMEWDFPLTAACVLTLQRVAEKHRLQIQWSQDLQQYADEQRRIDDYEQQIRLAIENIIKKNEFLPGYVTNTQKGAPMRHQMIAYHWGIRFTGLLLAHDPGLGKSRSAIDLSRGWYDIGVVRPMQQFWDPEAGLWGVRGGILVVTKAAMVRTWALEYMQWQGMTALEISGEKKRKLYKAALPMHAHVINYESLHCVMHNKYDAIVIDECHAVSNSSQQTENVLKLSQGTNRRLGLTGTPISNNLESAFYQMLIIDGGRALGPGKTKFLDEYFVPSDKGAQGHTKNIPKPGSLEAVSNKMARCTYFLKKEDAIDLPPKTHTPVYLDMTTDQARYYNKLKDDYLVYIQDSQVSAQQAAARMMKLRQMCQGFVYDDNGVAKDFNAAKVEALVDMLKTKFTGRKVVVWAVFTHEINMLCQRLMQEQIGFVRLDGTVTSKKVRDANLKLWNENPAAQVFIGQIQMGVGITLHANECYVPCYDCVYLGIDYSFINWTQSQDRIHRIGQKYPCSYTYLLTDDGVDRNIYQSLQTKANTSNAVYKAGKEFYASLVKGDEPNLAAIDVAA
ncbi:MAG: DEAD/DEAH box helicase [Candidatus Competibacteraceae bacterium]|nr:DEAD/DEAH box helicase [Candidatus Competibacteraceae bacterium]